MKSTKGFTLIELLSVIVILVVIALITIPQILNIISSVKKSAAQSSANSYLSTVEFLFASNALNEVASADGTYDAAVFVNKKMKGTYPSHGSLVVEAGKINQITICVDSYLFEYVDKKMVLTSNDCGALSGLISYDFSSFMEEVTSSKTVTIKYPPVDSSYFMVTEGSATYKGTVVLNDEWVLVEEPTAEVTFNTNGHLIAKTIDDSVEKIGNEIVVYNIDNIEPVIDVDSMPKNLDYDARNASTAYNFSSYTTFGQMGGKTTCVSDLSPTIAFEKTNQLIPGTHNLTCTATGNNGKSSIASLTFIQTVKTDYTVDSIHEALKNMELPNGDYSLSLTEPVAITYPVEIINYYGNTVISSNLSLGDVSTTRKTLIVRFNGDLLIEEGVTVTATNVSSLTYKKGMYIEVKGKLTNRGTITMTARGTYNQAGENIYLFKNSDGTYEYIPAVGGAGAIGVRTTSHGIAGIDGTSRQTGGGGSGSSLRSATKGGNGSAGTSYSGGSGGGGAASAADSGITGGNAAGNGGAGGVAVGRRTTATMYVSSGGAGNPAGRDARPSSGANVTVTGNYTGSAETGTGGLLVIFANELENIGTISAKGSSSKPPAGYNTNVSAPGGSSGGGSVNIFANTVTNTGTITAAGGVSVPSVWLVGGTGGNGTVTIGSIDTGIFIKN